MKLNRTFAVAVVSLILCVSTLAQRMLFHAKVVDVVDGATVIVETQSKTKFVVKCQAITVPRHTEPYADESRERLSSLLLSQTVAVEYTERNQNGHLLGVIFSNGKDICLDQISAGLARVDSQVQYNLETTRRELYAGSEEHARNSGIGVWTTSATPVSVNQSPASSVIAPNASNNSGVVDVRGYFRKDGTYIGPHKRTAPDGTFADNWITEGNVNPYTGKPGTKSWFARNWWIFPTVGALIGTGFLLRRSTNGGGGIPCNDGTISQAQNRQGACSHHGGIR